jgi:hypothetical protein
MSAFEMAEEINQILSIPISILIAQRIIANIERYYDLKRFLKEEDI